MLMRFKQLSLSMVLLSAAYGVSAKPILLHSEQNIEEYQLDNGMRIILAELPKENRVYMNTIYLSGALNDPQGKGGLAHLLEHLAFKGTQNVQGEEYQRRLNQYTLSNNALTNYYSTQYINVIAADQKAINEILYLEAQRMDKLVLQAKFVPSEIDIVKREREIRLDQPMAVLMDQMVKAAYGNQHLGRLPIGDLNELQSIQLPELEKYYRDWYAPNNAVMVVTGKFNKAQLLKQIDQHFSPIPKRPLAQAAPSITLDLSKMQPRQFSVAKGSDYGQFNFYMQPYQKNMETALSFASALYSMQPNGRLYKNMVEPGVATSIATVDASDRERQILIMGAMYAPTQDAQKVSTDLLKYVEQTPANFSETDVQRVKDLTKNSVEAVLKSASAMSSVISNYVVSSEGKWQQFFADYTLSQNIKADDINQALNSFFTPAARVSSRISPTPEDQKQAVVKAPETAPAAPAASAQAEEAPKDIKTYTKELKADVKASKKRIKAVENMIQRGRLSNGMQYAFYPTTTRDDKIYASISVDFGTADSLFNQAELIGLTAYLMLKGSQQYDQQQIIDRAIAVSGATRVTGTNQGLSINISAKKEHFQDYFNFMLAVLKDPKFEQKDFDLIQAQSLASLDRSYTEPDMVAGLKLSEILEQYQPGDLRYRVDPAHVERQLKNASNAKIKALYQRFLAMNHAQIALTGEFDVKAMHNVLQKEFATWSNNEPFIRVLPQYKKYAGQKQHLLAEAREFGSYQAVLTLPVGNSHDDAEALMLLNHILGNSQLTSRLAQELREKNALVYGFRSSIDMSAYVDSGSLSISANYSAGQAEKVSQGIHKVLQDLIRDGVTEQELAAAKASTLKRRVDSLADERTIHGMLNSQLKQHKTMYSRSARDQAFAQLTTKDLQRVIRQYIDPAQLIEVMADQYGQAPK